MSDLLDQDPGVDPGIDPAADPQDIQEQPKPPVYTDEQLDNEAFQRLSNRHPHLFQPKVEKEDDDDLDFDPKKIAGRATNQAVEQSQQFVMHARKLDAAMDEALQDQPPAVRVIAKKIMADANLAQLNVQAVSGIVDLAIGQAWRSGKIGAKTPPRAAPANNNPPAFTDPTHQAELEDYNKRAPKDMQLTAAEYKEAMGL